MKKENLEFIFITVFFILVFSMKMIDFPENEKSLTYYHSTDFEHYEELTKWFIGKENNETVITYQYPPLYPILLIPITIFDTVTYLLFLNYQLLFLMTMPLFLISREFLDDVTSCYLSGLIVLFFIPIEGFSLLPILLSSFIFAWFIFFLLNLNRNKYFFWGSSVSFALLIMTKYVFFYLLPFIILWIFFNKKQLKDKIKTLILWIVPSIMFFSIWSIRNMMIHGISLRGMVGGYSGVISLDDTPLNIFFEINKFDSIISRPIAQKIFILYFIFIATTFLIYYFYKRDINFSKESFDSKKIIFIFLLLFNLLIFIFFPGMTWENKGFNIKYLKYSLPVYLIFPLILPLILYEKYMPKWKNVIEYFKK